MLQYQIWNERISLNLPYMVKTLRYVEADTASSCWSRSKGALALLSKFGGFGPNPNR